MELWLLQHGIWKPSALGFTWGIWKDPTESEKLAPLVRSCHAFRFCGCLVFCTVELLFQLSVGSEKSTANERPWPFQSKCYSHHHHRFPSWSDVWCVSPPREVLCVGAALCSCSLQPSGPWGCVGNAVLIHMPPPAGISKMGPLAGAMKQPALPPLPCLLQVLERERNTRENV